jgi:DNA-binding NtrC family response regulator
MMEPAARHLLGQKPFRNLGRLFDQAGEAVWVIGKDHRLIYVNDSLAAWVGLSVAEMVGHLCHPAVERVAAVDDVSASLASPVGLEPGEARVVTIGPPGAEARRVRFTKHGVNENAFVLAISGAVNETLGPAEAEEAAAFRQRLEPWRRQQVALGLVVAAGSSWHSARLRAQIRLAASTRHSFAIVGPRGCGGEIVARRIHASAARPGVAHDPILVVETPLMDAELLEATLSPAAAHLSGPDRAGVTLILRGVDEAPHDVQDRIVDFSQRSTGARTADAVRLIGLVSTSPASGDSEGGLTVKMSLALGAFELAIPPLANRGEDIPLIATALVESRHAAGNCVADRIGRAALDRLMLYPWPENFDELDAAIRYACGVCRSSAIGADDLPLAIRSFRNLGASRPPTTPITNLDEAMREFELQRIREAIESAGGNRSEAARNLGISRARLIRRLDGVDEEELGGQ